MDAKQIDSKTAEEINVEEVDELLDDFTKKMKGFSCPSSPQPP